jgi:hypothetical protein
MTVTGLVLLDILLFALECSEFPDICYASNEPMYRWGSNRNISSAREKVQVFHSMFEFRRKKTVCHSFSFENLNNI